MRRRKKRRKEIKEICAYTYAGGQGGLEYVAAANAFFPPVKSHKRATFFLEKFAFCVYNNDFLCAFCCVLRAYFPCFFVPPGAVCVVD